MSIHNTDIADIFNKIADLLDIKGDNPFRIRAYRNAARTIGGLSKNAADMVEQGVDLSQIPGIGKDLAGKIKTIVETGSLPLLKELESYTRSEAKDLVESLGGRATSSISGETDFLVLGENPGSKLDEAKKHQVKIIDEEEFRKMVKR
jgi:DNA polymerase (family 10)